jgi:hypothetical protein
MKSIAGGILLLSSLSLLAGGCSTMGVDSKRDTRIDVSRYKTYQWVTNSEARQLNLDNPKQIDYMTGFAKLKQRKDVEPQLKGSIDQELKRQGYSEVSGSPDFYVTYFGKAKDQDWISTWSGSVPSIGNIPLIMYPGFNQTVARTYRDGDLLLVFYDAKTKSPAWTGVMSGALSKQQVNLGTVTADLGQLVGEFKASTG